MPTPSTSRVEFRIRSQWIDSVEQQDGVYLPVSIPGLAQNISVPGIVKGLIKSPSVTPSLDSLRQSDTLKVFGVMKGIYREVQSVQGVYDWKVQYPIELLNPFFPEAVCRGDDRVIEWTVSMSCC